MVECPYNCSDCIHKCEKAKFFVFNGVRFYKGDKVRVTYAENVLFGNEFCLNTFYLDEVLCFFGDRAYFSIKCDGIEFKRFIDEVNLSTIIIKIEKIL